jgi:hypothetical protein
MNAQRCAEPLASQSHFFDGVFQSRPLPLMRSSELFKTLYLQTPLLQLGIQTSLEHAW